MLIAAALTAAPAQAQAAGFTCDASALSVSILGSKPLEPVTANQGGSACADHTRSLSTAAAGLPSLLQGAVAASTSLTGPADDLTRQHALAVGGVANLAVHTLPDLPLQLPAVTIPSALKSVHVDLSPLNSALAAAGGNVNALLGTVSNTVGTVGGAVGGATGTVGGGGVVGGTVGGLGSTVGGVAGAGGVVGTVGGTVGNVLGGTIGTRQASLLPSSIDIDLTQALQGLLPSGKLPSLDLLGVKAATAYAGAQCASGKPFVDAASQVSGVSVLGQQLPVDQVLQRTLTLINGAAVDPTKIDLSSIPLPISLTSLGLNLGNTPLLRQAVENALAALGTVNVLAPTLAQVHVTPGAKTRSGDAVSQQGLTVDVTVAGQQLLHAVLGQASAGATGVHCARSAPQQTTTSLTLQCTKRRLVLVDVLERGRRVKLMGVADPKLAGRTVSIVFGATGRTVAHARVHRDGSFSTTAPLPAARLRGTNAARYQARIGHARSLSLKLRRRMVLHSIASRSGKVTISGRVVPPLGAPMRTIVLERRVSCKHTEVVKRFKPGHDGSFRVSVRAPKGTGAAVYRLSTKVRKTKRNPKLFPTFTLPRAIELG